VCQEALYRQPAVRDSLIFVTPENHFFETYLNIIISPDTYPRMMLIRKKLQKEWKKNKRMKTTGKTN